MIWNQKPNFKTQKTCPYLSRVPTPWMKGRARQWSTGIDRGPHNKTLTRDRKEAIRGGLPPPINPPFNPLDIIAVAAGGGAPAPPRSPNSNTNGRLEAVTRPTAATTSLINSYIVDGVEGPSQHNKFIAVPPQNHPPTPPSLPLVRALALSKSVIEPPSMRL